MAVDLVIGTSLPQNGDADVEYDDEDPNERTLYIPVVDEQVTEELLYELFVQVAIVDKVSVVKNASKPHPFAFVEFRHGASVKYALDTMKNLSLFGKPLVVKPRSGSFAEKRYYEEQKRQKQEAWQRRQSQPVSQPVQSPHMALNVQQHIAMLNRMHYTPPPVMPPFVAGTPSPPMFQQFANQFQMMQQLQFNAVTHAAMRGPRPPAYGTPECSFQSYQQAQPVGHRDYRQSRSHDRGDYDSSYYSSSPQTRQDDRDRNARHARSRPSYDDRDYRRDDVAHIRSGGRNSGSRESSRPSSRDGYSVDEYYGLNRSSSTDDACRRRDYEPSRDSNDRYSSRHAEQYSSTPQRQTHNFPRSAGSYQSRRSERR